ncbi:hypothetical protein [Agrobacterium tumefaciens]|uniref:hypothetical protein n=1 Tax=Agrobacterium tumefaciens TaxID=358 RepID=UPI001575E014|nr:hypothetical protein [Agrobacterium tumefaciens]NTZ92687.1 hypothetical protein [Agrobacterium tumefaciens]
MLPPVPKISAADAAYGATVPPTTRGQPKDVAMPQVTSPAPDNGSSIFAKAAVASLTSEFQLSRSTAVLAETLGKLMNLPRRDGEAIETYVVRLTDALRAMPPAQRLALEQQISKALQGLSLSMLAEILKQPTGPEAARLALLIELSRYKGMDLAAKAVVSSYQQNNPSSPAPASPASPAAPPRQQNTQSQGTEGRQNATPAAQLANAATTGRLSPLFIGPLALGGAAIKAMVMTQAMPSDLRPNLPTPPTETRVSAPDAAKSDGKTESAARPPLPHTGNTAKEGQAEPRPTHPPRAENSETRPAFPQREMIKAEQREARTGSTAPSSQPTASVKDMENLLLAAIAGKLPAKAATAAQPSAPLPGVAPQQPDEQLSEKTAMPTPLRPSSEETETVTNRLEAQPLPRAALDPEMRMAMLEQSASQSLIAAALAKDGTPLPLVTYPPAEEDYESETPPRGGGPFSEDEAEGEAEGESAGSPDEADEVEERVAANDETGEQESPPEAAYDDSAENYYLRMSGVL